MRVGFIADPWVTTRGKDGAVWKRPPLDLLDTPLAWRAAAPSAGGDVYAGVVELDPVQVQALLALAQALGIRLALILDVDKADGTQPLSLQENTRLTLWMAEKGLPPPGIFEGQIDYVQRLARLLEADETKSIDRTLVDVTDELAVLARQDVVLPS